MRDERAQRALLTLSAALATRAADTIRAALIEASRDADGGEVEEVLLQAHLFVGFPDALNALVQWREVSQRAAPSTPDDNPAAWPMRGERVCGAVYGENYAKLRANVAELHPDMDRWMVVGGYGRVIGRGGLDLPTRELCLVALLAVWNVPRQLHSHLRGALNAGADVADVDAAVEIACGMLATPGAEQVRALWQRVRSRTGADR
jgi:4-carboxymuconolactone decarboxylase